MTATPEMPLFTNEGPLAKRLLTQKRKNLEGSAQATKKRPIPCFVEHRVLETCKKAKTSATASSGTETDTISSSHVTPALEPANPPTASDTELDSFFIPETTNWPSPITPVFPDPDPKAFLQPEPITPCVPSSPPKSKSRKRIPNTRPNFITTTTAILITELDTAFPTNVIDKPCPPRPPTYHKTVSVAPAPSTRTTTTKFAATGASSTVQAQKKRKTAPRSLNPTIKPLPPPRPRALFRPTITALNGYVMQASQSGPGIINENKEKTRMVFAKVGDKRLTAHFERERRKAEKREARKGEQGNELVKRLWKACRARH